MQALVKSKREPGLWLGEVEVPKIGINDVLIKVLRTGICGTDVHIYRWDDWAQETIPVPMAIGHEFVGRIVETGSNVVDFFPGDLVSGEGHVVCGRCRNYLAGRRHDPDGAGAGDQHVLAQHGEGKRGVDGVAEGVEDGGDVEGNRFVVAPDVGHG